ncbi:hypothetical protein BH09PLA1_BH09PLA1_05330 [soil metagenome]
MHHRTRGSIVRRENQPGRCNIESLEKRTLLSNAVNAVLKQSPIENNLAAQFIPESKFIYRSGTFLTKAAAGKPLDIALNYFRANANAFNITAADIGTPIVTDQYADSDTGLTHIYLRQQVNGLEIANASANFNVRSDGRILSIGSTFVSGITNLQNRAIAPQLDASAALLRAGQNLNLASTRQPQIISPALGTARTTVLRNSDLSQDDIAGRLQYVAAPDGVQLAWNFVLRVPDGQHWYDTRVGAADGRLLFTADWTTSDSFGKPTAATTGGKASNVAKGTSNGAQPQATGSTGTPGGTLAGGPEAANYNASFNVYAFPKRNPDSGPRTIEANPWDAIASQFGWQDTNGTPGGDSNITAGNNVSAQEDGDDNDTGGIRPSGGALAGDGSGSLSFDFPVDLAQAPSVSQNAAIVNLYYWNNILHDIHFRYGFNEIAGNFQQTNYTGLGSGNDRVQADAQDGGGTNNANFSTPPDGSSGRMQMYVWNFSNPARDGDYDAEIIIHEYGHGVSTRLTGGPSNSNSLNSIQSGGMGGGWSDWWRLMLLQTDGSAATLNGAHPVANYSIAEDAAAPGLRRYPYSFDKSINPMTWGLFNSDTEVHRTGELWTTTLWDMAVLLEKKWGFNANIKNGYVTQTGSGNLLAMKLVMDALKLQPQNPTFIQARDAILQADVNLTGGANQREIWHAFARRGLGTGASTASTNSTQLVEAFDVPASVSAPVVAHSTPLSPLNLTASVSSIVFRFSEAMNPASFNVTLDVLTFFGPGNTDLKASISGGAWSNSNKTLTIAFSAQFAEGTYAMTIGPNIQAADNGQMMDQNLNNVPGEAGDSFVNSFTFDPTPGPDSFAYEASIAPFQNINLASSGGTTVLNSNDDAFVTIPLDGNSFNFYGTSYSGSNQLFVNDNGLITFGSGSTAFANNNLTFSPTQPVIAPLWDDWATDANASDKVIYSLDAPNNKLIIEWSAVVSRGDGSAGFNSTNATFQAILSLNTGGQPGDIVFNYVDLNVNSGAITAYSNGGSATVGIKSGGTQGANGNNNRLMISLFNTPNPWLGDGKAVRIGLSAVPTTATVAGRVFEDRNGDGTQLAGENGIFDLVVFGDSNNNGVLDSGEPSANSNIVGDYTLTNVPTGAITIREIPEPGYIVTNPSAGNVNLSPGQTLGGISFGNFLTTYTGSEMTLRLDPGGTNVQVWINQPVAGTPTWSAPKSILNTLTFTGATFTDLLTIDLSNGNPLPAGGINYDGGAGAFDTLAIKGSTTADTVDFNATNVVIGGLAINRSNVEISRFDGRGGNDTLKVNAGASVFIDGTQHLASLNIVASGSASVPAGSNALIVTNALNIAGLLDLNDNDAIVFYSGGSALASVQGYINFARSGGTWTGATGLTSTTARNALPKNTTLGAMESADYKSVYGPSATFDAEALPGTAVLIKFTYYGDADFNGTVNFDDYSRIDAGFNNNRSGWLNGDFDGNGVVNFDDYSLIDLAFNTQGVTL